MSTADLGQFDGHDILGQAIKITRAGDGLSAALAIEPQDFHLGKRVYVVLETEVSDIGFKPVPDTTGVRQVCTLQAGAATTVTEDLVRQVLDEQARRIEEAKGLERLPFVEDADGEAEDDEADAELSPADVTPIGRRGAGK